MAQLVLVLAGLAVPCQSELTYQTVKNAADGPHTLTISAVDFGTFGFQTRGFDGGVPGPTFRMKPGETLEITLVNNLNDANNLDCATTNEHFCETATTNLHTHGLHVSSKGKEDGLAYYSDDVFAEVAPGGSESFKFAIPDYHMPGTHWYHPHHHHATALQAGGGAAGILIVDDPTGYLPDVYANMPEKILMLSAHNLQTLEDMADASQSSLLTDAVNLASTSDLPTNVFMVNGQLGPEMTITSHTWYRFRMCFAAVEQSLHLTATGDATCTFKLLAKDGIYLHSFPRDITTVYMYPGARADVAVSCTCQTYPCTATLGSSAGRRLRGRKLQPKPPPGDGGVAPDAPGGDQAEVDIMTITVTETQNGVVETLPTYSVQRPCYLVDLQGEAVPNANTGSLQLNGADRQVEWNGQGQSMTYDAVTANGGTKYTWAPITTMQVGSVYEIEVTGAHAHPLHIHINPYQIVSLPNGGPLGEGYFAEGDWHDTLLILDLANTDTITVRTHTDVFTGMQVVHCHILEHEDEGMMGFIEIAGTEGSIWSGAETVDSTCLRSAFVSDGTNTGATTEVSTTGASGVDVDHASQMFGLPLTVALTSLASLSHVL